MKVVTEEKLARQVYDLMCQTRTHRLRGFSGSFLLRTAGRHL